MIRKLSWTVLVFAIAGLTYGFTKPDNIYEYHLNNGLKVVVKVDRRAPVVVSQVWYKVGSADEPKGLGGISHVLEHMMFKGTKQHGPGEFSRIIAANGGSENAFTSRDYTAYFETLEKSRLPIALQLEADRMHNLALPQKEFNKEVKVVMEERRLRTDDNPQALTYEKFYEAAFHQGPYHHPIIGSMDNLNNITDANLRDWYERWYVPNNATLVVVGDVEPKTVYKLAQKYFGPIPKRKVRATQPEQPEPQTKLRRIETHLPGKVPYLIMGYRVPVLAEAKQDWEPYALEVLSAILDGGPSSRLQQQLVRQSGVAAGVSAGYNLLSRFNDLLVFEGVPNAGVSTKQLEAAIQKVIQQLQDKPVTAEELATVKAQVRASKVYQQDSVFYQAMEIGMYESVGLGWRRVDDYSRRVDAVTAAQVQAVARKYLRSDRLTIATLHPSQVQGGQ